MTQLVKIDRFKVAYLDDLGADILRSEMCSTQEEAEGAGERSGMPYLVMEWLEGTDGLYSWRVLPVGYYGAWRIARGLHRYRWQIGIGVSSILLSLLILYGANDPTPATLPAPEGE